MELLTALTGASQVMSLLRGLTDALKRQGMSEELTKVIELQAAILGMQAEQSALLEENRRLVTCVQELQAKLELLPKVQHRHGAYWVETKDAKLDGPFSASAWDRDKKLVRMTHLFRERQSGSAICFKLQELNSHEIARVPEAFITSNTTISSEELSMVRPTPTPNYSSL